MFLAIAILICFAVHTYLTERMKRKAAYTVHVQGRTEEAEQLDFAVHLFEDETMGQWQFKLERAYSIMEARRGYNNQRMIAIMEKNREAAKNITPIK